jgi:hypothetical protein
MPDWLTDPVLTFTFHFIGEPIFSLILLRKLQNVMNSEQWVPPKYKSKVLPLEPTCLLPAYQWISNYPSRTGSC